MVKKFKRIEIIYYFQQEIIEKTTKDYYWGCGEEGTGKILMETREILRK